MLSKLEGKGMSHKGLLEIYDNNPEMVLAIIIQNCLHPKTSQRFDAIKNGTYTEIDSPAATREYLSALIEKNLEHEMLAMKSQVNAQIAKLAQIHEIKVLMEASDVFVAAAALSTQKFFQGKGDRTATLQRSPNWAES